MLNIFKNSTKLTNMSHMFSDAVNLVGPISSIKYEEEEYELKAMTATLIPDSIDLTIDDFRYELNGIRYEFTMDEYMQWNCDVESIRGAYREDGWQFLSMQGMSGGGDVPEPVINGTLIVRRKKVISTIPLDNVTNMRYAYANCTNLTGSPVCGPNVTNMSYTYFNCVNLTGSPVCGPNVTSMSCTYQNCCNLTGNPVCGNNVTGMSDAYYGCSNLTGQPVCGPNVTDMRGAYHNCYKLTGDPVCGPNVESMSGTYWNCYNLTGAAVTGPKAYFLPDAYAGCLNISGNAYILANNVNRAGNCFGGRNSSTKQLNIYVPANGLDSTNNTLNTFLINTYYTTGTTFNPSYTWEGIFDITKYNWVKDNTNNCYKCSEANAYIYPVANVEQTYKEHQYGIITYTTTNTSMRPTVTGLTNGYTAEISGNQVMLLKNNPSDVVTQIGFKSNYDLKNVSYMTNSVTNMYYTYHSCGNLISTPPCGNKVTDMTQAYYLCDVFQGPATCGNNVTSLFGTYMNCKNLTGSPACGDKVTEMGSAYRDCIRLTGSPVCGNSVVNMSCTYYNCRNLSGIPVCGANVTNMSHTYYSCNKLTGAPVCGSKVTNMAYTYSGCNNLTGNPVCGNSVINMAAAYHNCRKLTGSPVVGPNVTSMFDTYRNCVSLTGSPVCGNNVTDFTQAYRDCTKLTGNPVCGPNVTDMSWTYANCTNISGNMYVYSNNVSRAQGCFNGKNVQKRLNIIVTQNSTSYNTFMINNSSSLVSAYITWTNDMATNKCYYNTAQNIYIYPVSNVAQKYKENELGIIAYTTTNTAMRPNTITGLTNGYTAEINGNQVMLLKNNPSDRITFVGFSSSSLTGVSFMTDSITAMNDSFSWCENLKGSPICGPNVTNMLYAYAWCSNITGQPVCGPNVTTMHSAYYNCTNLTGSPVCGPKVTNMCYTYEGCPNLYGDFYVYNNVTSAVGCFSGRNTSRRLNIIAEVDLSAAQNLFRHANTYNTALSGDVLLLPQQSDKEGYGYALHNSYYNVYIYTNTNTEEGAPSPY